MTHLEYEAEQAANSARDQHIAKAVKESDDLAYAMSLRCEAQGHDWVNCCSVFSQVYQECRWCGERRRL